MKHRSNSFKSRFLKWCPNMYKIHHNGKTKRVKQIDLPKRIKRRYFCFVCKGWFTKKQIDKFNKR